MSRLALSFIALVLLYLFIPVVSAQMVRDDTFIPMASAECGSVEHGCFVASMTSMIASLNDSRIGTNTTRIFNGINSTLGGYNPTYPYPTYAVIDAAVRFITSLI